MNNRLDLIVAVKSFYLLEELKVTLPFDVRKHSHKRLEQDIILAQNNVARKTARAMKDYCLIASLGEARHSYHATYDHVWSYSIPKGGDRHAVYSKGIQYTEKSVFEYCEKIFNPEYVKWTGGYGGKAWHSIISAVPYYYQWGIATWLDHAIDLSHNNGTAFNKSIILWLESKNVYLSVLDAKRNESLLLWLNKHCQKESFSIDGVYKDGNGENHDYSVYGFKGLNKLERKTAQIVERARTLGLISVTFNPEPVDLVYPAVSWGIKELCNDLLTGTEKKKVVKKELNTLVLARN